MTAKKASRHSRNKKAPDIDFEKAFLKGHRSYDTKVGDWWDAQASNGAHRKAYREVALSIRRQLGRAGRAARSSGPRSGKAGSAPLIVDYGCGSGHFLVELAALYPQARIVALDGSTLMLARARLRLAAAGIAAEEVDAEAGFAARGPRIRLVRTSLPNFSLPQGRADAVAFLFPNLTPAPADQPYYDRHGYKKRPDTTVARMLARFREMDPEDEIPTPPADELYDGLMTDRVVSRHIRSLLKRDGHWFKVDYANALREELSDLTNWRGLFTEGALEEEIKGETAEIYFKYLRNDFRRSQVILDVYHQTKDESDRTGGYFISTFRAV